MAEMAERASQVDKNNSFISLFNSPHDTPCETLLALPHNVGRWKKHGKRLAVSEKSRTFVRSK